MGNICLIRPIRDGSTIYATGTDFEFADGTVIYVDKAERCDQPTLYFCSSTSIPGGFIILSPDEYDTCKSGPSW